MKKEKNNWKALEIVIPMTKLVARKQLYGPRGFQSSSYMLIGCYYFCVSNFEESLIIKKKKKTLKNLYSTNLSGSLLITDQTPNKRHLKKK